MATPGPHIIAGGVFTCAGRDDGTTWCWGDNSTGELATAPSTIVAHPVQAPAVPSAPLAFAAGDRFACAIAQDGSLSCWGDNSSAQLGLGTTAAMTGVHRVSLPRPVVGISAAAAHACAVLDDQTLWCWGDNTYGASAQDMGIPTVLGPRQVLDGVAQVASGEDFSCALRTDRSVWCWGGDVYSDLGDDLYTSREVPMPIAGLTADGIAAGDYHACAIVGGAYRCWGSDSEGEVGYDAGNNSTGTPGPLSPMTGFVQLAMASASTCGLQGDGSVWCFGDDHQGQLGIGDTYAQNMPVQIDTGGVRAKELTGGGSHMCAVLETGSFMCWGRGSNGELGNGVSAELVPQPVSLPGAATAIAAGDSHVCAIAAGSVYCWGDNDTAQTGTPLIAPEFALSTPTQVPGITNATAITAGDQNTCVVASGGVLCFGNDFQGALGDAASSQPDQPIIVPGLPGLVKGVSLGGAFGCAIASSNAWCWGDNNYGELGDQGAASGAQPPTQVPGTANLDAIASSDVHACALDTSGGLWCWGANGQGELGLGTYTSNEVATQVMPGTSWTALASGGRSACAIAGGTVECWGANDGGELGDGTPNGHPAPAPTVPAVTASALSMRRSNTCAITSTGLSCWGHDDVGQLGDGALKDQLSPVGVAMPGASAVAVGSGFACAIVSGNVSCWGDNVFGQLGNGRFSRSLVPIAVLFP